jgi:hypothetical protein
LDCYCNSVADKRDDLKPFALPKILLIFSTAAGHSYYSSTTNAAVRGGFSNRNFISKETMAHFLYLFPLLLMFLVVAVEVVVAAVVALVAIV